ncbi:endoglucanase [Frondihabitans sp. PhB188]|uniref:glycoside hydrolase family 6 protein n=1 Tax=Frondihabitans sp. PhB188 TaxID=2485200 RepID=UPI000F48E1DA|nr:glycoside hydrolase family 6 protein [Frondihabitans sp. PhB188]ROQ38205.1 endoglucanase [Frondihabitans sp. PhB188]
MAPHHATLVAVSAAVIALSSALLLGGPAGAANTAKPLTVAQIQAAKPSTLYPGGLAVHPDTKAASVYAGLVKAKKTTEAAAIKKISSQPVALWLGDWYSDAQLKTVVAKSLASAEKAKRTPTFVTYAIPDRDCGDYSAGGLTADEYGTWNQTIATALKGHRATVIVEPDALAMISNCPGTASVRLPLIKAAVTDFAAAGVTTYIDAGNSHWVDPAVMADRLEQAGIAEARGFSTNVSNFYPTADEKAYGLTVSKLTGGSHFVIDTSRNGQGWKGTWCNPTGAGLGVTPRVASGRSKVDALLWIKTPGASDGTCNGGPTAGTWWQKYALALVKQRAK